MKVLHVFPFFSIKYAGGTCDLIYKLAKAQKQRGHNVTIYTGDYKIDRELVKLLPGCSIKIFSSFLNGLRLYLMPGMISESKKNLRNYDIIHLHCFRIFQNLIICHYARKYNIPYVIDAHGSIPKHKRRRNLKGIFDTLFGFRILKNACCCIAETNLGIDEYREYGVANSAITLIQPPFPVEDCDVLPPKSIFKEKFNIHNKKIIMFIGRIHWIKGIDFLLESFYELTQLRDDVLLVIVGSDDGFKATLDDLIRKLNIADNVCFTGFLSGTDKLSALVDADIVVQTSRYEQGAWAPIEAVLCGTPIIVSSNSGAGEDIKKMNAGYLVEWGNKFELRDMMQYILDNPEDTKIKTTNAANYIRHNLSMSNKISEYEELYLQYLNLN